MEVEVTCGENRQHSRGARNNKLPARCSSGLRNGRHAPRIRVPLQTLEVGAYFRSVLVAQVAILFQALIDDALQLRRQVWIQPHRGRRSAVEDAIENGC